jgi:large subunit ribosomal protein L29
MKTRQLRELSDDEIKLHQRELQEEIFNLRMQKAIKQISNPKRQTTLRHEMAKCHTLLHEREMGIRTPKGE